MARYRVKTRNLDPSLVRMKHVVLVGMGKALFVYSATISIEVASNHSEIME